MLEEKLKKLGFTEKEEIVYLALLKRGKALPSRIASDTGITRPTVYSVAKSLIEKGVVTEDLGGKTIYLVAEAPGQIFRLVEKEKSKLKEQEELAKEIVKDLSS